MFAFSDLAESHSLRRSNRRDGLFCRGRSELLQSRAMHMDFPCLEIWKYLGDVLAHTIRF